MSQLLLLSSPQFSHPQYLQMYRYWFEWRYAYNADLDFINTYLKKLTTREDDTDFENRRSIAYVPAFAKEAVNEVRNAIFQRMVSTVRVGGDRTYKDSVLGLNGGVNNFGAKMNSFIGTCVLPELLVMAKVGIFVDMPRVTDTSLYAVANLKPYLYIYTAEQILTWDFDTKGSLIAVLLEDRQYIRDEKFGLPTGLTYNCSYRHIYLKDGQAIVDLYDKEMTLQQSFKLGIPYIPFVIATLSASLMANTARYQMALMNLASTDMAFLGKANFPFYVEQVDERAENFKLKEANDVPAQGKPNDPTIRVGAVHGRRIAPNVNFPQFIAPPSEPLKASMEKQEIIKREIRQLTQLSVASLQPTRTDTRIKDESTLESGLSYIGLELEHAERQIATIWAAYMKAEAAHVKYPEDYSLKTDADRLNEAKELTTFVNTVPSIEAKREILKKIAALVVGPTTTPEKIEKINKEIDKTVFVDPEPKNIQRDVELGIASREYAAQVRGYPEDVAEQAEEEHVRRVVAIAEAQNNSKANAAARGVPDLAGDPEQEAKDEKKESQGSDVNPTGDGKRGEGK